MNRRSPASPSEAKPFSRAPPQTFNQWSSRPPPQPPQPSLPPNFANQRLFTPQSSYIGQPEDRFIFSPALNMNQTPTSHGPNYGQPYNYNHNPYESPPMRPMHTYGVTPDANRPVYSTPGQPLPGDRQQSHIDRIASQLNIEDVAKLQAALEKVNRAPAESSAPKSESPESTSGHSGSQSLNALIKQLSKLNEEICVKKKTKKDVESKIEELDEELKQYEKKIQMRDCLRNVKNNLGIEEESLQTKITKLVKEMDRCNTGQVSSSNGSNTTDNSDTTTTHSESRPSQSIPKPSTITKPSNLKRPNPNPSNTFAKPKKVRIQDDKTDSSTPKTTVKPPMRRTPMPTQHKPTSTPTTATRTSSFDNPSVGSPKVDRLCRKPTPKPTVTSGVRTSRPVKIMSSRSNRLGSDSNASTEKSGTPVSTKKPSQEPSRPEPEKKSDSTSVIDPILDALDEFLEKTTNTSGGSAAQSSVNNDRTVDQSYDKQTEKQIEEPIDETLEPIAKLIAESIEKLKEKPIEKAIESQLDEQKDKPKDKEPEIEMVEILSDDEDFAYDTVKVKTEKPDPPEVVATKAKEPETYSQVLNTVGAQPTVTSEAPSVSSSQDSLFKVPSDQSVPKKSYKFVAFDNVEEEPTVNFSLMPFKPVPGPKLKGPKNLALALKSFKDYLIISFADFTVRSYHIEDKKRVVKYEGHENHVFGLIVIKCEKVADTWILYTGGKDKKIRAYNAMTGTLLNSIEMSDEINCLDSQWSHIFCALSNGLVCKVPLIHDNNTEDYSNKVKKFIVNSGKRVLSIICIKAVADDNSKDAEDIEPVIALTPNKMRVINTKESVADKNQVLLSLNVTILVPAFMRAVGRNLFVSFKTMAKTEDKKNVISRVAIYDLHELSKSINSENNQSFDIVNTITSLNVCKDELIMTSFSGKIQCIDCAKRETKWFAFSENKVMGAVKFGERLVVGTDDGRIEVIYLDQKFIDCDVCGVTFARQMDLKRHIREEHSTPQSTPQSSQSAEENKDEK